MQIGVSNDLKVITRERSLWQLLSVQWETVQAAIVLICPRMGIFVLSCSEELAHLPFALPSALLQTAGTIN